LPAQERYHSAGQEHVDLAGRQPVAELDGSIADPGFQHLRSTQGVMEVVDDDDIPGPDGVVRRILDELACQHAEVRQILAVDPREGPCHDQTQAKQASRDCGMFS
jgi:hypothetical protein